MTCSQEGWTYLHYASLGGNVDQVNRLISCNADINAQAKVYLTQWWHKQDLEHSNRLEIEPSLKIDLKIDSDSRSDGNVKRLRAVVLGRYWILTGIFQGLVIKMRQKPLEKGHSNFGSLFILTFIESAYLTYNSLTHWF
jgi:hypothetical protein